MKGTIILITANAISKILGAVLKIPLTYILGEQGMAIYQTAFSVYIMFLALTTSGMPLAISRYTACERALGRYGNIHFSVKFSVLVMSLLGIVASLVMFFGADFFAFAMKDPKAALAIRAISPAVFFVALGEVYKSFYQGYACQTPTAISQVTESLIKLVVGYALASWFAAFSHKYSSAAATFGVSVGEFFATLVLILMFIPFFKELKSTPRLTSRREISHSLAAVALPMTAISLVGSALALLETSVIRNLLTSVTFDEASATFFLEQYSGHTHLFDNLVTEKRLSYDGARWLFGAYSGYAATVFNLPVGILASFGVSILPIVTNAVTLGDTARLQRSVSTAARTAVMLAVPCSVVMAIFPGEILDFLFKNTASNRMLSLMAPLVVTSALSQLISAIMQASGKIMTPFWYSLICSLLRIALSVLLISVPCLNILGAIISSFISALVYLILGSISLKKEGVCIISPAVLIKISVAGGIMAILAKLLYPVVSAKSCSGFITLLICCGISFAGYILALYTFGMHKKEEITHQVISSKY